MFRKFQKQKPVKKNCPYCKEEREPDYKNHSELRKYMSERGRILGRARTGICAKHQRRVDQQIKRARYIGYLPFVEGL
ncbi:30S ribosomal protein S18 [Candidatus Microgenomates bacterium]|nr:30S ribosomal protein S18 [Candidatus Microgenomates bacterium]